MGKTTKSRREALGLIGKTGIFLGVGSYFFLSLKTSYAGEADTGPDMQDIRQRNKIPDQEKAVISGSGSRLTLKITGKPGRYFFVGMAASDEKDKYRAFPGTKGIINPSGNGSVYINLNEIINSRIYLKIFTSETERFDEKVAETEAFIINTKDGRIDTFEGLVSRPVLNSRGVCVSAEKPAQVVSGANNKYRFN